MRYFVTQYLLLKCHCQLEKIDGNRQLPTNLLSLNSYIFFDVTASSTYLPSASLMSPWSLKQRLILVSVIGIIFAKLFPCQRESTMYLALRHMIVPRRVEDLFDDFFYIVLFGVVGEHAVPLCVLGHLKISLIRSQLYFRPLFAFETRIKNRFGHLPAFIDMGQKLYGDPGLDSILQVKYNHSIQILLPNQTLIKILDSRISARVLLHKIFSFIIGNLPMHISLTQRSKTLHLQRNHSRPYPNSLLTIISRISFPGLSIYVIEASLTSI